MFPFPSTSALGIRKSPYLVNLPECNKLIDIGHNTRELFFLFNKSFFPNAEELIFFFETGRDTQKKEGVRVALWELSILLLAILVVGGLAWMSKKKFSGSGPYRKNIHSAQEKTPESSRPIQQKEDMEVAEEVTPPLSYQVSQQEKHHVLPEIPHSYGDTYITAIARDPYWVFAHWEVSEATKEDIRKRYGHDTWGSSRPVLKVYDATNLYYFDSREAVEIQINSFANNWYVNTGVPGHSYFIELGRILPDGIYIFIARSNMVSTPRDDVSEIVDLEWLLPTEYEKRVYGRYIEVHGSPGFIEEMALKAVAAKEREEYISSPMDW